jgi:hypothetical protein
MGVDQIAQDGAALTPLGDKVLVKAEIELKRLKSDEGSSFEAEAGEGDIEGRDFSRRRVKTATKYQSLTTEVASRLFPLN